MKNYYFALFVFLITILVIILMWDNYMTYLFVSNPHIANNTAPSIILPKLPSSILNLFIVIIGIFIIFGVLIAIINRFK